MSEPRPKYLTPEAALRVGARVAEQLVRHGIIKLDEQREFTEHIAKHGSMFEDGYQLAKALEDNCYWNCDLQMAEELDTFSRYAREEIEAAEKEWAERNAIAPPLPIDTRIKLKHGDAGTITGIYDHGVAKFLVKVDGDPLADPPTTSRRIINFEDAQRLEDAAA